MKKQTFQNNLVILIAVIFWHFPGNVLGQVGTPGDFFHLYEWHFTYDESGNRIRREVYNLDFDFESNSFRRSLEEQNEGDFATLLEGIRNDFKGHAVYAYPNPFVKEVFLETKNWQNGTLYMYTSSGQLILHTTLIGSVTVINTEKLTPGIYHIVVETSARNREVKKLVKLDR